MATSTVNVELRPEPLDVGAIYDEMVSPDCGAISLFIGTTRDNFGGRQVVRLEYEAYEVMAKSQLESIAADAKKRFAEVRRISIVHRIGLVPASEASVVVAAASPHRKDAMDAVNYLVEKLKADVAIWKKEVYADGDADWKANAECAWK